MSTRTSGSAFCKKPSRKLAELTCRLHKFCMHGTGSKHTSLIVKEADVCCTAHRSCSDLVSNIALHNNTP